MLPLDKQNPLFRLGRIAAVFLGWLLTIAAIQSYFDFRELLRTEERWFSEDVFFVTRTIDLQQTLGVSPGGVSEEVLEEMRSIPGVRIAEPVRRNDFPAWLHVGGGALPSLTSEVFVESVPDATLSRLPDDWNWSPESTILPLLIPRDFLNLYNFGFAPGKGLPPVSENMAQNIPLTLEVHSNRTGMVASFDARILGFSNQIQSLVVPDSFLKWANEKFGSTGQEQNLPGSRIIIAGTDVEAGSLVRLLENHSLQTTGGVARTARLQMILDSALALAALAGLVILLLNSVLQWTETEANISRNQQRIRILFLLGHSPGRPAWLLIYRQILSITVVSACALITAVLLRTLLSRDLIEAGFRLPQGLHPTAWMLILLLYALLITWLSFRTLFRLRALYLSPQR